MHHHLTIEKVEELLGPYIQQSHFIDRNIELSDVTLNLQESTREQICFYNLNVKSREMLDERFRSAQAGLLILNGRINEGHLNKVIVDEDDFFKVQRIICEYLYPHESQQKIVGVTGTNGKSTVIELCRQMGEQLGQKSVAIGTLGVFDGKNIIYDHKSTTPSYIDLRKILNKIADSDLVFMEISSHALDQDRIYGLNLDGAAFVSFSQDHLDYHLTLENYLDSKIKIAKYLKDKSIGVIIPTNNDFETKICDITFRKAPLLTEEQMKDLAPEFIKGHNKDNLEVSLEILRGLGFQLDKLDLSRLSPPKGRFETFKMKKSLVIVDYAHTPDALVKICHSIKLIYPDSRLITLFGCGGNRDKTKRPLMGAAVSEYSDFAIVSTDNPRYENPAFIIKDIIPGMTISHEIIEDREEAIRTSIQRLSENEILLIAGKGHESYQEIKGVRYPFSDQNIVLEEIKKKEG